MCAKPRPLLNEDPIRDGLNWYAYAGNNPVNFADPLGLFTLSSAYYNWFFQKNPDANWMKNHQAYTSTMEDRGWKTPVAPSGSSSGGSSGSGNKSSSGSGSGSSSSGGKSSGGGGSLGYGGIGAGSSWALPRITPYTIPTTTTANPNALGGVYQFPIGIPYNPIIDTSLIFPELDIYGSGILYDESNSAFFIEGSGDGKTGDDAKTKGNQRGVEGKGWRGDRTWKGDVDAVRGGGTIQDLGGRVPTEQEAKDLINEAGGTVDRVDPAHPPGGVSDHTYPHINYHTPNGKGTIKIKP